MTFELPATVGWLILVLQVGWACCAPGTRC